MAKVHVRTLCSLSLLAISTLAWGQGVPPNMRLPMQQRPPAALPASAPTAPANVAPAVSPMATPTQSSVLVQTARLARVDYSGGLLTVTAENSSLNQILREISRLSNLKITGGVADERVYGTYGPAPLPAVLATLLNGTGSNMLLIQDASAAPQELVLTPRQGGASPPNPMASRDVEEQIDFPPQLTPHLSNIPNAPPQRENPARPQQWTPSAIPISNIPPPGEPVPINPPVTTTPDTTTEQSPNGVKTPQQIYDQLIKMQQQQSKVPQ